MSEFKFASKQCPCEVCGGEDPGCKTKTDSRLTRKSVTIFVKHHLCREISLNFGGKIGNFVSETKVKKDQWTTYISEPDFNEIHSQKDLSEVDRQKYVEATEKLKQENEEQKQKRLSKLLPNSERNLGYRQFGETFGLSSGQYEQLKSDRGLRDDEISFAKSLGWISSWYHGEYFPSVSPELPGIDPATLKTVSFNGLAIYCSDGENLTGLQVRPDRKEHREKYGKYLWVSSSRYGGNGISLKNGEQPIFVWRYPGSQVKETWLVEGGLKSLIVALKLWFRLGRTDIQVIGSAGANWVGSKEAVSNALEYDSSENKLIVLQPDSGSTSNKTISEQYKKITGYLLSQKHTVKVGWWKQVNKTCGDIDELEDFSQIEYISSKEFFTIAKLGVKNAETKKIQEQKDNEKRSQFDELKAIRHGLTNITEVPYKVVNVSHLGQVMGDLIEPGTANIIIGDAGTGKTESIVPYANKAEAIYSWHNRISLARSTSSSLGLTYKEGNSNVKYSDKKKASFCAPSAYQYDPKHLAKNQGILLVDEADQVFDFLFGSLCNKEGIRPLLLSTLESHIDSAIYGQGMCIFMSADITQKEIDLIKALAPQGTPVRLIINKYQPQRPDINFDVSESPEGLLSELVEKIATGIPCFVLDDLKNGVKGCKSLAEYVRQHFPELKDLILEIHADNQHDPRVKAFNDNPNEESKKYLMIICSPSIISGVSLKNQRFINGVFAFCNGILMDREIKQFLNRVRGAKDIYMWVSEEGFEPMGLPSNLVTPEEIAAYYQRNYEANSKYLLSYKTEYQPMTGEFYSPYFTLFCKNQAYRSITAKYLRQFTREHLEEIGYGINEISPIPEGGTEDVKDALSKVWNNIEIKEAEATAAAEILCDSVMDAIEFSGEIPSELLPSYRKTKMLKQFGEKLIESTVFTHKKTGREFTGYAAMALKNSRGEYQRHLENFYLLSQDIQESQSRDYNAEDRQLKHGERFAGDVRWNARKRKCREFLGLHEFINPSNIDNWIQPKDFTDLANKAKTYAGQVDDVLNLDVSKLSPGQIFGEFMNQLGIGLDKKSVPGQKWKLRRINKQDWEYCQMYVDHKASLKAKRELANSLVEVSPVEVVEVDPIVLLVAEELVKASTREECEDLFDTITETQKLSAWQLISVEHQQRITNLFSQIVEQLSLDDIKPEESTTTQPLEVSEPITNNLEVAISSVSAIAQTAPTEDITNNQLPITPSWKGLLLRIREGLAVSEKLYQDLLDKFQGIGRGEHEPIWNEYLRQWVVNIQFSNGCRSIPCDWVEAIAT